MSWSKESQECWKSAATIISLLAVPVILAIGGWVVQRQLTQAGIKQQYVQLALEILREPPEVDEIDPEALRQWAVELVDLYDPVKLTNEGIHILLARPLGGGETIHAASPEAGCNGVFIITGSEERYKECLKEGQWIEDYMRRRSNDSDKKSHKSPTP